MLPDKRVTLIEPDCTEHKLWSTVTELGGRDAEIESTLAGRWRSRFEFDWNLQDRIIDDGWSIIDDLGQRFNIESVERPSGDRAWDRLIIVTARRTQ